MRRYLVVLTVMAFLSVGCHPIDRDADVRPRGEEMLGADAVRNDYGGSGAGNNLALGAPAAVPALAPALAPPGAAGVPEVWMGAIWPASNAADTPLGELIAPGARWDFVKQHLDGVIFHINRIGNVRAKYGDPKLIELIRTLQANHVRIAIEAPGPMPHSGEPGGAGAWGEASAREQLPLLEHLYALGGRCDLLDIDNSVSWSLSAGLSAQGAAAELTAYERVIAAAHPDIRMCPIVDFPRFGWRGRGCYIGGTGRYDPVLGHGDYFVILNEMIRSARGSGVPFAGLTIDCPYEYAMLDRPRGARKGTREPLIQRLVEVERYAKSQGLDFDLIANSEKGGGTSDAEFYKRTLDYVDRYRALGGSPTRYLVESWYTYPQHLAPETPYTLTGLVKTVILRVKRSG